jgi:hypothetical protein
VTFEEFRARAQEIFDDIPPEFRAGVDGLEVTRQTVPHPSIPEVYTLGECLSEHYPSEFGGPGEVRSVVALYYGSFLALSRLDETWDWEDELFETVTHEVRHHLESLALEDALEVQDYVEDQNFARRHGEAFDPFFFRSGAPLDGGAFEVGGDVFLEVPVEGGGDPAGPIAFAWEGTTLRAPRPAPLGDVHFLRLEGLERERGDLYLVLVRRKGLGERVRDLLRGAGPEVLESDATPEKG